MVALDVQNPAKIAIYTVAEPVRLRDGSEWIWDCTLVISDHELTRQSTRDLHHKSHFFST